MLFLTNCVAILLAGGAVLGTDAVRYGRLRVVSEQRYTSR